MQTKKPGVEEVPISKLRKESNFVQALPNDIYEIILDRAYKSYLRDLKSIVCLNDDNDNDKKIAK